MEWLAELFDAAPMAVLSLTAEGKLCYSNRAAEQWLGFASCATAGVELTNHLSRADQSLLLTAVQGCLAGTAVNESVQVAWNHADGTAQPLVCRLTRVTSQTPTPVCVIYPEAVTSAASAAAVETRWDADIVPQSLLEKSPHIVLLVDRNLTIVYHNTTTPGFSPNEILHQPLLSLCLEHNYEILRQSFAEAFDMGRSSTLEVDGYGPHRKPAWYTLTIAPVQSQSSPTTQLAILYAIDFTEQRRVAQELETRKSELAHVSRLSTLGAMVAELAHELNQPLSAISSFARGCQLRLQSEQLQPMQLRSALSDITAQATRAGDILHAIRDFLRKRDRLRKLSDINQLIRGVVPLAAIEARNAKVRVELDMAGDLPQILVDRTQIEQVVLNLLLNAIEAMHEVPVTDRQVEIRTCLNGSYDVQISVLDHGVGLSNDSSQHLFEAFYSTKPQGMGMGLSISRTIVEDHGGRIWATPNLGPGVTFALVLPIPEDLPWLANSEDN